MAADRAGGAARRRRRRLRQGEGHARRLVRFRLDASDGDGRARGAPAPHRFALRRDGVPGRSLSRGLRPAPRLVPFLAPRLVHAERHAAVQGAAHARLRRRRQRAQDVEVARQRDRAAAGVGHAGRGDPAALGRRHRLLGRAVALERDPEARGRGVSPHPQHACASCSPTCRISIPQGTRCRSATGSRSTATRVALASAFQEELVGALRPLRVPLRRAEAPDVLLGGPRRVLSRHPEGPALHDRARTRRRAAPRRTRSITSPRACCG